MLKFFGRVIVINKEGLNRVLLKDNVPLNTPLVVQAHIIGKCNLRCKFCAHALNKKSFDNFGFVRGLMTLDTFKKFVNQAKKFASKLKTINIAGIGEPLLHPDIAEFVAYAKNANVADRIEVVTNAVALTPAMSDKLIDAGADRLRISINGLSDEDYHNNCAYRTGGGISKDFR